MEFLEQQARLQYRMLGHEGFYTRVRCQDVMNEKGEEAYVKGEDEVIRWFKSRNLRGNLFLGRNPYDEARNIVRISAFSLDIDPVRPKKTASTEEQLRSAITVGQRVLAHYGPGNLCSSGNGALVIFPFVPFVPDDLDLFVQQCKQFEDKIRKQFEVEGVTIDRTYDARRFLKCLGSVSTKGERGMWRNAKFLANPVFPSGRSRVLEEIRAIQVEQPRLDSLLNLPAPEDRSAADYALALKLKEAGFDAAHVFAALKEQSHRPGREDDYKRIVTKLFDSNSTRPVSEREAVSGHSDGSRGYRNAVVTLNPSDIWTPAGDGIAILTRPTDVGMVGSVTTGFKPLDAKLQGGYRGGVVYAVEAPTNRGKSAFLIQAANTACVAGRRVLFVATEADVKEVVHRYVACHLRIPAGHLLEAKHAERLKAFDEEYKTHQFHVFYTKSPNLPQIEQLIEHVKPEIIFWDYYQHFETEARSRTVELSVLARWYESTALKYQIPLVVAAQLHDQFIFDKGKKRRLPASMDQVKDCKVINDASKVVMTLDWLTTEESSSDEGPVSVRLNLDKNKGPMGDVLLTLNRAIPRFE